MPTVIFLTRASGSSWAVPADWNAADNSIEVIGAGGGGHGAVNGGAAGAGGGGGAYSKVTNLALSGSITFQVGAGGAGGASGANGATGGDTWFNGATLAASSVGAKGGGGANNTWFPPSGGAASAGIGTIKYSGGDGGAANSNNNLQVGGGGGGGAAGPNGAGGKGGDANNQPTSVFAGGGGGGNGGGTAGGAPNGNVGGAGGNNSSSSGSGAGGNSANGTAGTDGGGGGGGGNGSGRAGGAGGAGTEFSASYGSGGGGGGGGANATTGGAGGDAGSYGGGGGGAGAWLGSNGGGDGADGLIVITYEPVSSGYTLTLDPGAFTLTGQALALRASRRLPIAAGAFTLSGQALALRASRRLGLAAGAFTLSGQALALRASRRVALAAGAFTLSGQALALRASRRLPLAAGTFSLSGQPVGLRASRRLPLSAGSFLLTGQDLTLRKGYSLTLDAGAFTLSGQDVALRVTRRLPLEAGAFLLTGQTIGFTVTSVEAGSGYLVLQVLSGTFADNDILSATTGSGYGRADGTVQFGDYLFDIRGGSTMVMPAGQLLQSGFSHRGAPYAARVESTLDSIVFGDVWGYNWQTASGDWATGAGRVIFNNHIAPGNALLPTMMLRNNAMDAFGGNGRMSGAHTWEDMGFASLPDGIGFPFGAHSLEGSGAATGRGVVPSEQEVSAVTDVFRTAGGGAMRLQIDPLYTWGGVELRVYIPVTPGKAVLDEFWFSKPAVKAPRAHTPYTSGIPDPAETIYVNTVAGSPIATIEDKRGQYIGGNGPRAGWGVTLADVTGNPGGVLNAVWNATFTVVERLGAFTFTINLGEPAATTASNAGGSAITIAYSQTSALVFNRRFWVQVIGQDSVMRPIFAQASYQGETQITINAAAQDWTVHNNAAWWYAEPRIPTDLNERVARGRAPLWATHMMIVINWQDVRELDPVAPPPWYLTDFFANVV